MSVSCPHCGAAHPRGTARCPTTGLPTGGDPGLVGSTLAGRYQLVRLLGDGGMGAVYKAVDQVLRRFVAIKLLHPNVAENPRAVERFLREARSAAAIGHPNIIDVLDFGESETKPYLVMEYLRGRSLAQLIAQEGPIDIERACVISTHTLAGLAAAHDRGILHRDLKPANLMLVPHLNDPEFVKICDFGFAALVGEKSSPDAKTLTPARTLVGTPAYASPERLRGDDGRDPRTDVYAVGVVLFEMLTGFRPYDAPTFAELARKVRKDPIPSLRALRPEIPAGLDAAIARALAKEPQDRWHDAAVFAEALVPYGGRTVPTAAPPDDDPSDAFTADLLRIRARETKLRTTMTREGASGLLNVAWPVVSARAPAVLPGTVARREAPPLAASWTDQTERSDPPPIVELPPARPLLPVPAVEDDPSTLDPNRAFEGALVLAILRFVERRFGVRALKIVLDALPTYARSVFDAGITPGTWVPYPAVRRLIERIDATLGRDDLHLVVDCGRAAAEGAFDVIRTVRPPEPTPEVLFGSLPEIGQSLTRGVDYVVHRVGRGFGRLELVETATDYSLTGCVATLGFLDRSLERFGAGDVEVNLLSCRALGDPLCLFDATWLS